MATVHVGANADPHPVAGLGGLGAQEHKTVAASSPSRSGSTRATRVPSTQHEPTVAIAPLATSPRARYGRRLRVLREAMAVDSLPIQDLIDRAEAVLRPRLVGDRWFGDVAAAIETVEGNVFVGVCVDTGATGYCAEQAAGAAMITAGETRVRKVVAVWRDSRVAPDAPLFVLPPCGVCRRFLVDIDPANADAEVVLGAEQVSPLSELLPLAGWSAAPARP